MYYFPRPLHICTLIFQGLYFFSRFVQVHFWCYKMFQWILVHIHYAPVKVNWGGRVMAGILLTTQWTLATVKNSFWHHSDIKNDGNIYFWGEDSDSESSWQNGDSDSESLWQSGDSDRDTLSPSEFLLISNKLYHRCLICGQFLGQWGGVIHWSGFTTIWSTLIFKVSLWSKSIQYNITNNMIILFLRSDSWIKLIVYCRRSGWSYFIRNKQNQQANKWGTNYNYWN